MSLKVGGGKESHTGCCDKLQNTFTVHKELLCLRSRFFNAKLGRPFDTEILTDVLVNIDNGGLKKRLWDLEEDDPWDAMEDVPSGYIPLWASSLEQYRNGSQDLLENTSTEVQSSDGHIELTDEHPRVFKLFLHWLYTRQLVSQDAKLSEQCIYASLYSLAERLDVPTLRHECYSKLRGMYKPASDLPNAEVLGIIVNQCSPNCVLRKHMVQLFAHAVTSERRIDDGLLDTCPSFYDEVAREITRRLLTREESQHPHENDTFGFDESDLDVESMGSTTEGDSDFELDHVLGTSDNEDVDSLFDSMEDEEKSIANFRNDLSHGTDSPKAIEPGTDAAANAEEDESTVSYEDSSTAEDDAIRSAATDDEESATHEPSDESEGDDVKSDASDSSSNSSNSVKVEPLDLGGIPRPAPRVPQAPRKRQKQRPFPVVSLTTTTSRTVDQIRTNGHSAIKKRKRHVSEDENNHEANKENCKRTKG